MKTILFVCYGNTHRSPIAEGLLKSRVSDEVAVVSAGIHVGSAVAREAVAVMRDIGIDIRSHSPQQLTKDLCTAADIIICMDREVSEEMRQICAGADNPMECWEIPDPVYSRINIVQVRDAISNKVADLAERLGL